VKRGVKANQEGVSVRGGKNRIEGEGGEGKEGMLKPEIYLRILRKTREGNSRGATM